MTTVHVVGAGLAGLSGAVQATEAGHRVVTYDAAGHAGGRCRSLFDAKLGRIIDNGNHLLFSGNRAAVDFARKIGSLDAFLTLDRAVFPFFDLASDAGFQVSLNEGPLPVWILNPDRRIPGAGLAEHLSAFRLLFAGRDATVADTVRGRGPVWRDFVEPLTLAAINTVPEQASARLLSRVLWETFVRGGAFCRPMIARKGLSQALIDPALAWLRARGCEVRLNARLRGLEVFDDRVTSLSFAGGQTVQLAPDDAVILALPPERLAALLPEIGVPEGASAIINAHFRLERQVEGLPALIGVLGGKTHWIFVRGDVLSVTISAADALGVLGKDTNALLEEIWSEVVRALGLVPSTKAKAGRLITEKRATFLQTPANEARRPDTRTAYANLVLAGDATNTGLPATIEGSLRSGVAAAKALKSLSIR